MKGEMVTYLLHLEGDNYYIGRTTDVIRRLTKHFAGRGSQWTRLHRPISIMGIWPGDIESTVYFIAKALYGIDSVRGAGFSRSK